jgi:hypothetical protein
MDYSKVILKMAASEAGLAEAGVTLRASALADGGGDEVLLGGDPRAVDAFAAHHVGVLVFLVPALGVE